MKQILKNSKKLKTLRRHAEAINKHTAKRNVFFDYGNAFLLESSRAGANVMNDHPTLGREFKYPSYVQGYYGTNVFRLWIWTIRWFVLQAIQKI